MLFCVVYLYALTDGEEDGIWEAAPSSRSANSGVFVSHRTQISVA